MIKLFSKTRKKAIALIMAIALIVTLAPMDNPLGIVAGASDTLKTSVAEALHNLTKSSEAYEVSGESDKTITIDKAKLTGADGEARFKAFARTLEGTGIKTILADMAVNGTGTIKVGDVAFTFDGLNKEEPQKVEDAFNAIADYIRGNDSIDKIFENNAGVSGTGIIVMLSNNIAVFDKIVKEITVEGKDKAVKPSEYWNELSAGGITKENVIKFVNALLNNSILQENIDVELKYNDETVKVNIKEKKYTVTVDTGIEGKDKVVINDVKYGTGLSDVLRENSLTTEDVQTMGEKDKPGYTFDKWIDDDGKEVVVKDIEIKKDVTVKVDWTANTDTKYQVWVYYPVVTKGVNGVTLIYDDNNPSMIDECQGTTDTTPTINYSKYISDEEGCEKLSTAKEQDINSEGEAKKSIAGAGNTIYKLYFDKKQYKVVFKDEAGLAKDSSQLKEYTYYHGETAEFDFELESNDKNYNFASWKDNEENTYQNINKTITEDITFTAVWRLNDDLFTVSEDLNDVTDKVKIADESIIAWFKGQLTISPTTPGDSIFYPDSSTENKPNIKVGEEGKNKITFHVGDTVKNALSNEVTILFGMDTTGPDISVPESSDEWSDYEGGITIPITDSGSGLQNIQCSYVVGEEDSEIIELGITDFSKIKEVKIPNLKSGENTIKIVATDNVGNSTEKTFSYKKDNEAPAFVKEYDLEGIWAGNEGENIVISDIKDDISGIANISVTIADGDNKGTELYKYPNDKEQTVPSKIEIPYDQLPEGEYKVRISIQDSAQNITTENNEISVKKDTTIPSFKQEFNYDDKWANAKTSDGDINYSEIGDKTNSSTITGVSGIADITVDVYDKGTQVRNLYHQKYNEGQESVGNITIPYKDLPEGEYTVKMIITDAAGNNTTHDYTVKKDITDIAYTPGYNYNDKWANAKTSDGDINYSKISDKTKSNTINSVSGIADIAVDIYEGETTDEKNHLREIKGNGGEKVDDIKILYDELKEGVYTVKFTAKDIAGNVTTHDYMIKKDITIPTFETNCTENKLVINNNVLKNTQEDNRKIQISNVIDTLSGNVSFSTKMVVTVDNNQQELSIDDKLSNNEIKWDSLDEGEYNIVITATDAAQNQNSISISVDKDTEDPSFTLFYARNDKWTNASYWDENVEPKRDISKAISISNIEDDNSIKSIDVSLYSYKKNENNSAVDLDEKIGENIELTGEASKKYIAWDVLPEGDYALVVTITDGKDNVASDYVIVKKDVTAPSLPKSSYKYDNTDKTEAVWANKYVEDGDITYDGISDIKKDSENKDITVSGIASVSVDISEGDNEGTELYKYPNDKEQTAPSKVTIPYNQLPEGQYTVTITITDGAGNISTDTIEVKTDITDIAYTPNYKYDGEWANKYVTDGDITYDGISDIKKDSEDKDITVSGVASILVQITDGDNKGTELYKYPNDEEQAAPSKVTIPYKDLPEGVYTVTFTITDNAGNVSTDTIEVKKDITDIAYTPNYNYNGKWANKYVEDGDITYDGISDIKKDSENKDITVSGVASILVQITDGDNKGTELYKYLNDEEQAAPSKVTIPYEDLPEGVYTVTFTITDGAGNVSTDTIEVKKDITDIAYTPNYNYNGVWANKYVKDGDLTYTGISDAVNSKTIISVSGIDSIIVDVYEGETTDEKNRLQKIEGNGNETADDIKILYDELKEGVYTVRFIAKDVAGNDTTMEYTVKKDITNTTGKVTVTTQTTDKAKDDEFTKLLKDIVYMLFSNKTVKVTLSDFMDNIPEESKRINNKISKVASAEYTIANEIYTSAGEIKEAGELQWKNYDYDNKNSAVKINANDQAIVYFRLQDNAGNITYISTNGIIVDEEKPVPKISITETEEPTNGIYNEDVSLNVKVTEPVMNSERGTDIKTYSGIKSVKYEVINKDTNKVTASYTKNYEYSKYQKEFTKDFVVAAKNNNSNNVIVRVTAIDNAGNEVVKEKKLKIDVTAPKIHVSYNNAAHEGKYYRENRVATITVTERNFDKSIIDLEITKNGSITNQSAKKMIWKKTAGKNANGDDTTYTTILTYSDDADYTFSISGEDKAGNKCKAGRVTYTPAANAKEFTVDKTQPKVSVTYDKTPSNGKYYNKSVTVSAVIKEHNFDANAVKFVTKGATKVGKFLETGKDTYTATISYDVDAECEFGIQYTDKAGNNAKYDSKQGSSKNEFTTDEFVVDMTAPQNIVFKTKKNSANNGSVSATYDFNDAFFYDNKTSLGARSNDIKVSIKGYKNGDVTSDFPHTLKDNGNGGIEVEFGDFPKELKWDDVYTITTTVADLAGNESSEEIIFSVNRFGSNYVLGTATEEMVNHYYTNKQQDVEVYEISASTTAVDEYSISTIINGDRRELSEEDGQFTVDHNWVVKYPEDYDVNNDKNPEITGDMIQQAGENKDASVEGGWKINHYTVKAENFDVEGAYSVVISSTDKAGNSMASNTSEYESSKNVEFVYDKSSPEWHITNKEDNDVYKGAEYDFNIQVTDDISNVDNVKVTYNDKTVEYGADKIKNGVITYTVQEALGTQELKVEVTDKAGNVSNAEKSVYEFRLTSNVILQFLYLYWVYLVIMTVIIVAGIIIVIYLKKRNSDK